MTWEPVPAASSYRIYWNTSGSVSTSDSLIEVDASPYSHTRLTNGLTYYYALSAVGSGGASGLTSSPPVQPMPVSVICSCALWARRRQRNLAVATPGRMSALLDHSPTARFHVIPGLPSRLTR